MNIETKAFRIIYDIICIVLRWDKHQITDKQAMREIVETLASEPEIENEFEVVKEKKIKPLQIKNKILIPSAICAVFVAFFVGAVFPFTVDTNNTDLSAEDNTIRFEQQEQSTSELENKQNTFNEQFGNQTIPESSFESGG